MVKLCIAGAAGRMGQAIINDAILKGHQITGAIEAPSSPAVGKRLRELGLGSDTKILSANHIKLALQDADVFISFTAPMADLVNIPVVADMGKRIILGTTGFNANDNRQVTEAMMGKVPAVFSPNYSIGVNILFKLAEQLKAFPSGYDVSISEIHHTAKKDAPSGTAKKIEQIISQARNYNKTIYGREGISPRQPGELESTVMRLGGVPGIHDIVVAGPNEMLRIEHTAFTRNVFAQGAVTAAEWINKQTQPKIYSMADVLGLT
ncbi:MAG TPA: 4-hydroxy-tetrahydrodipicolinate reductase [Candidatus Acidoferrales bacterium]|nr:4-hydroxy-tetrahydrodipicolinate reductase [Candidatus Acidoferrales bacterium]